MNQELRASRLSITLDSTRHHMDTDRKTIKFLSVTQKTFVSDVGKSEQISAARSFVARRMHTKRRALADHTTTNLYKSNTTAWVWSTPCADHGNLNREVKLADVHTGPNVDVATISANLEVNLSFDNSIATDSIPTISSVGNSQQKSYPRARVHDIALQVEGRGQQVMGVHQVESESSRSISTTGALTSLQVGGNQYGYTTFQPHISWPVFEKPAIAEVRSVLDPFVHLPTIVSAEEKSLIHFCRYFGKEGLSLCD